MDAQCPNSAIRSFDLWLGASGRGIQLPKTSITLEGTAGPIKITPDGKGSFRADGLKAGPYKVSISAPQPFSTGDPVMVNIEDKGCRQINLGIFYDGRIRGRVVGPSGEGIPEITLTLSQRDSSAWNNCRIAQTSPSSKS